MKKIFLSLLLAVLIIPCAVLMTACGGIGNIFGGDKEPDEQTQSEDENGGETPTDPVEQQYAILTEPFIAEEYGHTTTSGVDVNIFTGSKADFSADLTPFETATRVVIDFFLMVDGVVLYDQEIELDLQTPTDYFSFRSGKTFNDPYYIRFSVSAVGNDHLFHMMSIHYGEAYTPADFHYELRQITVYTNEVQGGAA